MNLILDEKIRGFCPSEGNWSKLEILFEQVFSSDEPAFYYHAIFNLFERFPQEDGAGVFWSALHGMETFGGYEKYLVQYYARSPTEITKIMLIRLRNAGKEQVNGVSLEFFLGKP